MSSSSSLPLDVLVGSRVKGNKGKRNGTLGTITLVEGDPKRRRYCVLWDGTTSSATSIPTSHFDVVSAPSSTSSSDFVASGGRRIRPPTRYRVNADHSPPSTPTPSSSDNESNGTLTPASSDVDKSDDDGDNILHSKILS